MMTNSISFCFELHHGIPHFINTEKQKGQNQYIFYLFLLF
jgi:hypothetical protein